VNLTLRLRLGQPQMTVEESVLGCVDRTSVHPTCRTIFGGGSLCLLLTAQDSGTDYPVKAAGPPLILQGYIPAGAPGGAWSKVFGSASGQGATAS